MEPINFMRLRYKDLAAYTDNFSERNYIGRFQFGKLYRGIFGRRYVIVKIWEVPEIYDCEPGDNQVRLMEENILLRHEILIKHPCMVKLYGYCCMDIALMVAILGLFMNSRQLTLFLTSFRKIVSRGCKGSKQHFNWLRFSNFCILETLRHFSNLT